MPVVFWSICEPPACVRHLTLSLGVMQKSRGTWEAAKEATMEAEKQGAEAHLKSCEAEHLLATASELTQTAASARAREEEVSTHLISIVELPGL